MSIQQVIEILNKTLADGIIEGYAVGGAVGATFYLEPVATIDVDVFVSLEMLSGSAILNPKPLCDYLNGLGFEAQGEYIMIYGWPVQFLPPPNSLVDDALHEAMKIDVAGTVANVMTAEYLAAICLQTGRAKDKARLAQFLEEDALDRKVFEKLIEWHGLSPDWRKFRTQFLGDTE